MNHMIETDVWFYENSRKELRKIIYRVNIGLEDQTDLGIACGILSSFLHSDNNDLKNEAQAYIERYPCFQSFSENL